MKKRVLITGSAGFFGSYMCEYLANLDESITIMGADIKDCGGENCDSFYKIDLCSSDEVAKLVKQSEPDFIIHLAGTFGTEDSQQTYSVNILSITGLLEAVRKCVPDVVVIAAGSAAEYGRIEPHQLPVGEQLCCEPVTRYGMSKYLATQIALYYHRVHSIRAMIIRPFQLIGRGVTSRLAPGAFAEQLKRAVASGSKLIKVGNLQSSRDFLDIHDAVEAVWALCKKPAPGNIFNLCSGKQTKMGDLLQTMIEQCGADVKIEVDPARLKGSTDVPVVYGSFEKLKSHCGWEPKRDISESISEMFK